MTDTSTPAAAPTSRYSARDRFEARLVRLAQAVLGALPLTGASLLGSAFGELLYRIGFARGRTAHNLDVAFGASLSPDERARVVRRCYRHFGEALSEFLAFRGHAVADIAAHLTLANREVLDAALAEGKGVLLEMAHFGSWEILEAGLTAAGYPLTLYAGGQRNGLVDDQINATRRHLGAVAISRSPTGVRGLLRALKAGHITALVADQHESTKRHYVSFFGQPVSAVPGPYQLAKHTDAPTVFVRTVRVGRCRYRAEFDRLAPPQQSGNEEQDLLAFTQQLFTALERDVRAHPDHYFWMHRRFRPIPWDTSLTDGNKAFLAPRLSGPVDSFWEPRPRDV
jgi:Kdo2-lipid IVA lauroyltransferase/acyltransferase